MKKFGINGQLREKLMLKKRRRMGGGGGDFSRNLPCTYLMKTSRMSLILAGSILLNSPYIG
jgi:hypothetical protein